MLQDLHAERDLRESEHDQELEKLKENSKDDFADLDHRSKERQEKDAKVQSYITKVASIVA